MCIKDRACTLVLSFRRYLVTSFKTKPAAKIRDFFLHIKPIRNDYIQRLKLATGYAFEGVEP